ncbi:MAG: circularly permuted type 2 ATP-grasp protein, partial [Acidimicrobiales bacterium]|nr:circularly permuted type 2 ATP-grasp protein [Acidimicrobiales bacterium]
MDPQWSAYDATRTHDELLDEDGLARPGCEQVVRHLRALGPGLADRQAAAADVVRSLGITFTVYSDAGNIDREWPVDVIPRIITAAEWSEVEAGLVQRLSALNRFVADLYGDQTVIADGVFPEELLRDSVNFRPQLRGIRPPGDIWIHICGSDLVRDGEGRFHVLEDNLRVPSGVSYMLENRAVSKRVFADLFRDLDILPVDAYPHRLAGQLAALSPRDQAAPVIAVLTPGVHNSAYYEHVLLSQRMGAHLVEGQDLVVTDDVLCMRTVGGLVRVDVLYRRIDDLFLDPDVFRPDSVLGVLGLIGAWAAGNVTIANAPGAGVADDKVVYSYVPDLIRYYLGEEPLLANVPTWRCMDDDSRAHVLDHLDEVVCKPANESGGYGVTVGSQASPAELAEVRRRIIDDPRNWIAQPILSLSTAPTLCDGVVSPRHVDLRPFVLSGPEPYVTAGGLTRVALREGSLVV